MPQSEKENFESIRRVVNWTAGFIAVLIATAMPAGYFYTAYEYESARIETGADQMADAISEMIYINPERWFFEEHRLTGLLNDGLHDGEKAFFQVLDPNQGLLAQFGTRPVPPVILRSTSLFDGTELVGEIKITESLRPILLRTGIAGGFGVMLAAAMFFAVRLLPFRILKKTLSELSDSRGRLRYLAYHDALTDLPNRLLFMDRLAQVLLYSREKDQKMAVLFIDLDDFKQVNDTAGHAIGDLLLKACTARMITCIRERDTLARLGGDEFTLSLLEMNRIEDAAIVAQKIITALKAPFKINQHELFIGVSIGVSVHPQDGENAEALMINADAAMYRAKEMGKNAYQIYEPAMNKNAVKRMAMMNRLRKATEEEEFILHYQPQYDLRTGRITGAEALIRWNHPQLGFIAPGEFIPLAEETSLIIPISEWVLKRSCAQNIDWQAAGLPPIRIAVNISGRQFAHQDLCGQVRRVLKETGLDPACLEIEMTESILMQNTKTVINILHHLKEMGVSLAIDDFGTGYSSLSYLQRFPIDLLKIDRAFVTDITTNTGNEAITSMIINIAHTLNMRVISEGIETEAQETLLRAHHCDIGQGFYFSKPIPADRFFDFYQRSEAALASAGNSEIKNRQKHPLPPTMPEKLDHANIRAFSEKKWVTGGPSEERGR